MPVPIGPLGSLLKAFRLRKRTKGFTLIELLLVMVIIGALAAISIPVYKQYINNAKITVAYGTLDIIRKTLELFQIDNQEYPREPIDFTTGRDSNNSVVFSASVLEQIQKDLTFVSYNSATNTYTFIAKAKNDQQTEMTLTPNAITH